MLQQAIHELLCRWSIFAVCGAHSDLQQDAGIQLQLTLRCKCESYHNGKKSGVACMFPSVCQIASHQCCVFIPPALYRPWQLTLSTSTS